MPAEVQMSKPESQHAMAEGNGNQFAKLEERTHMATWTLELTQQVK